MKGEDISILAKIIDNIKRRGYITIEDALTIEDITGYKFSRILDEIKRGRAKEYLFKPSGIRIYFYTGRDKEYLILPEVWFCSCMSKHPSNLLRRRVCYHLIVFWLARVLNKITTYTVDDNDYSWIIDELL